MCIDKIYTQVDKIFEYYTRMLSHFILPDLHTNVKGNRSTCKNRQ